VGLGKLIREAIPARPKKGPTNRGIVRTGPRGQPAGGTSKEKFSSWPEKENRGRVRRKRAKKKVVYNRVRPMQGNKGVEETVGENHRKNVMPRRMLICVWVGIKSGEDRISSYRGEGSKIREKRVFPRKGVGSKYKYLTATIFPAKPKEIMMIRVYYHAIEEETGKSVIGSLLEKSSRCLRGKRRPPGGGDSRHERRKRKKGNNFQTKSAPSGGGKAPHREKGNANPRRDL